MRSIDIHAHITPQCFYRATEGGGDWHTLRREQDARGRQVAVIGGSRLGLMLGNVSTAVVAVNRGTWAHFRALPGTEQSHLGSWLWLMAFGKQLPFALRLSKGVDGSRPLMVRQAHHEREVASHVMTVQS